jgi:hypothetical protein
MKRLLARVGLPMMAAAVLAVASVPAANADPAYGSDNRCNGPIVVRDDVTVTTCTYKFWWDYGARWSHQSRVKVHNGGKWGPIYVTPDIEVGFSVHRSGTTSIAVGAQQEVWGDPVYDIPGGTHIQGRANLSSHYWSSTMTLGGRFP